ncbi:MAG: carboxypeptidase-like regulatory domain-containing protein, partial [Planctomycetota bacterium]
VRSGADGRFLFASVVPGKVPLAARARGLAPWQQEVEVAAGRREEVTIRLLAGAVVFGTVRDGAGVALAKVDVQAGDWDDLGSRRTVSAADGTFRIEGLPVGELVVRADDDQRGKANATLQLVAGEQRRWDPVLSAGVQLRGRVLDHDGKPVAKVMVEGQQEKPSRGDWWHGFENTDADGRFALANCKEGKPIRLAFRRQGTFPELVLTGVVPTAEEVVVTLPKEAWVHIQGTVLGPDDEVLPNVHVSPYMKNSFSGSPAETADAKTGAFRYGPYPPGTYGLTLSAAGFPTMRLPDRQLGPDETWDLGTLKFVRGGNLVVQIVGSDVPPKWTLEIQDEAGSRVESVETQQGAGRSSPLVPGSYRLQVGGEKFASARHPFEIRADRETRLDVPVNAGVLAKIECTLPLAARDSTRVLVTVRSAGGEVVWRGTAWPRGGGLPQASIALPPGDYAVSAEAGELAANGSLRVAAPGPGSLALTLQPR